MYHPQYRYRWTDESGDTYEHVGCDQDNPLVLFTDIPIHNQWHLDNQPPPPACSICGATEADTEQDDFEWPGLIDIEVTTAVGEEGYAAVTQLYCARCWGPAIEVIKSLGFRNHHHGSIDYLEDEECPGWGRCPTPTERDNVVVPPPGGVWKTVPAPWEPEVRK